MVYRRRAGRRQGTRHGSARRRRRTSIKTRVRYQRPTNRVQKRQIATLARMAVKNARILNNHKVYTDWTQLDTVVQSGNEWFIQELMNPIAWTAVLRRNTDVGTQSSTFVRDLQFSWNCKTFTKNEPIFWNVFIVSIRKDANAWIPDPITGLVPVRDYVSQGSESLLKLNPGIFKVHFAKGFKTFPNEYADGAQNAFSTYRRGAVTLPVKYKLRSPADRTWKDLSMIDLPYYMRLRLLVFPTTTDVSSTMNYQFEWASKFTCINQD